MNRLNMKRGLALFCFFVSFGLLGCADYDMKRLSNRFDTLVGQHKDDLVVEMGLPVRCISIRTGEACEWIQKSGTDQGPVSGQESLGMTKGDTSLTLYFDPRHTACAWLYDGFYGVKRSIEQCK